MSLRLTNNFNKNRLTALREVIIFCAITIIVHYLYRYWANILDYKPITQQIWAVQIFLSQAVISGSEWVLSDVLNIKIAISDEKIFFTNGGWVGVSVGCSAFKPMLQFMILMIVYPGPWKKKLWFIPAGIIMIHILNIVRIVTLSLITHNSYSQGFWDFTHDYILRPLFYAVIFTMWVIWVEIIAKKEKR